MKTRSMSLGVLLLLASALMAGEASAGTRIQITENNLSEFTPLGNLYYGCHLTTLQVGRVGQGVKVGGSFLAYADSTAVDAELNRLALNIESVQHKLANEKGPHKNESKRDAQRRNRLARLEKRTEELTAVIPLCTA